MTDQVQQAVQQVTAQDYEHIMEAIKTMKYVMVLVGGSLGSLLMAIMYFLKSDWELMKKNIGNLQTTTQTHSEKFAFMDGHGSATEVVAEKITQAAMHIAGSIEKKYERRRG